MLGRVASAFQDVASRRLSICRVDILNKDMRWPNLGISHRALRSPMVGLETPSAEGNINAAFDVQAQALQGTWYVWRRSK
jgi:hypothetical protein